MPMPYATSGLVTLITASNLSAPLITQLYSCMPSWISHAHNAPYCVFATSPSPAFPPFHLVGRMLQTQSSSFSTTRVDNLFFNPTLYDPPLERLIYKYRTDLQLLYILILIPFYLHFATPHLKRTAPALL
ncbi:hypothetical protein BDN72DRAFT_594745 [Pluteus cervinus]|uniref:Uncharacterized protein n=1 Tax=Pluteus cervinus TaxID=181527 RepID=A0ACD3AUF8_9AGAR|nr:hypothetical protein BDN72DRAFT_594745 [Pluteus cervinus]